MSDPNPAMDFIREFLRKKPEAEYAEIRREAEAQGFKIYPIMYGRAKSLLGLIPEGGGRTKRAKRAQSEATQASREPRRLRAGHRERSAEPAITELNDFVERFRSVEEERDRYRAALVNVEHILREALKNL